MEQKTYDGVTSDISLGGMSLHSSHNLCTSREMDVVLRIPPLQAGGPIRQLRIRAKATHTVLMGEADVFRTGIQFIGISEADREYLRQNLEQRYGGYKLGDGPVGQVQFI